MSLTRFLGTLALAAGGSTLLCERLTGLAFFGEAAESNGGAIPLLCTACVVVGLLAVRIGMWEEQEFSRGRRD